MIGKLLPVLLALVGLGLGAGAGLFLRPASDHPMEEAAPADGHGAAPEAAGHGAAAPAEKHAAEPADGGHGAAPASGGHGAAPKPAAKASGGHGSSAKGHGEAGDGHDYVKLNNQFIVPIVAHGKVGSMVILSLSLEVTAGSSAQVYSGEPKLRDAFLQVLFDHANAGGFAGNFTEGTKMQVLRNALLETAVKVMGPIVTNVLIDDIVRQDT